MIRLYNEEDIEDIITLEKKILNTTLGDSLYIDLENPFARHYVYIDNNKLLGYISSVFDGDMISIMNFCVDDNYQNKHIGSSLLNYLLIQCMKENNNLTGAILEVRESNKRAIHVYESFGFKNIHTRKNYYSDLENALVLMKEFNHYDDILNNYLANYCNIERKNDYIKYSDNIQADKYFHNYYKFFDNENALDFISENNDDYLMVLVNKPLNIKNLIIEKEAIMYSSLKMLNLRNYIIKGNIKIIDNDNDLYNIIYNDSIKYGKNYANSEALRKLDKHNNIYHYGIYIDNTIIGYLLVYTNLNSIYITDFFILPEYQHQGYGVSLFKNIVDYYKNNGYFDCYLCADLEDSVINWYQKIGFVVINKNYYYRRCK